MSVSVWIREQLGCKDEYFLQYVVVLHILLETPFLVHCLHFLTTVGCTACSLFFIKHLHFMLVRLILFKKIANFVFHNAKKMQKRPGKVDTYAPMSGCFFQLIRSTRHACVGGGLNGRF